MLGNGGDSPRQRNLHPTYHNKPVPAMQMASQMSHLNEEGRSSNAYRYVDPNTVPAVPTTWDTVYDPSHPDADWSGLVSRNVQHKKHNPNHIAMQETIEHSEFGIISKESTDFARKRNNPEFVQKNSGSLVIGGIDDPANRYNTSYRRFESHEGTNKEQLTLDRRIPSTRRVPDPAQSRPRMHENNMNSYNAMGGNGRGSFDAASSASSDPRKGVPKFGGRGSLLSGLGEKLITDKAVEVPIQETRTSPRMHEHNTNKLLMAENYNPFPGKLPQLFS